MIKSKLTEIEEEIPAAEESADDAVKEPKALEDASDSLPTDMVVEKETQPKKLELPSRITVIYRGEAHAFNYGAYTFRPGTPATLPREIAEELLTYPYEKFEVKE